LRDAPWSPIWESRPPELIGCPCSSEDQRRRRCSTVREVVKPRSANRGVSSLSFLRCVRALTYGSEFVKRCDPQPSALRSIGRPIAFALKVLRCFGLISELEEAADLLGQY